jgi:hypothetical protein
MRNCNIPHGRIGIGVNPEKCVLNAGIWIGDFGPKRTFTNSKFRGGGVKVRFIWAGIRIW